MGEAMPTWRKAPPELIAFFDQALPDDPRVERRKMFGYPCAFTSGNMFVGLHQETMVVRLGDQDRAKLLKEPGTAIFEPMPGRPMREYVALPAAMTAGNPARVRPLVARALAFAAGLPAKQPKAKAMAKGGAEARPAPAPRKPAATAGTRKKR
jgi:TfoX/Sxy family transcriptional regulator of competence genes